MTRGQHIWMQVRLALHLLTIDPQGLKGAVFRVRTGPVRDALLSLIRKLAQKTTKIHPNMSDEQLFGGVDVVATLTNGHLTKTVGLLQRSGWFELTMAERTPPQTSARLCQALDQGLISPFIAFDEGVEGETLPSSLEERLAFYFDLSELHHSETDWELIQKIKITKIGLACGSDIRNLAMLAHSFGIKSLRAPILALNVAKANAAANARTSVQADDLEVAVEMVFPSRATQIPQATDDQDYPQSPPEENKEEAKEETENDRSGNDLELPNQLLIEAVKALLPRDFLELQKLQKTRAKTARIGFGMQTKSNTRGRPKPPRKGRLDGHNRIDIIATLRAAAPLQTIRQSQRNSENRVLIYPADIQVKRFQTRSERVVIFAVDASGSAALARLSEAKGAIELLLGQAYARRDHVALIGFRNTQADLLLPPTRSLVQTKRRLAELPGGGSTPLAMGIKAAAELAQKCAAQGKSPMIVILTDGRANITLDGNPDRAKAMENAHHMARIIAGSNVRSVVMDVGNRPNHALSHIARDMRARYFALPRADGLSISNTIEAELDA